LKKEINPTNIKVGIKTLKTIRDGRLATERSSEEEINSLISAISTKFGEKLEIIKTTLRKPNLIIYNVTEEITIEKATIIIKDRNPEITPNGEEIVANFGYKNKKGKYNMFIELGPKI